MKYHKELLVIALAAVREAVQKNDEHAQIGALNRLGILAKHWGRPRLEALCLKRRNRIYQAWALRLLDTIGKPHLDRILMDSRPHHLVAANLMQTLDIRQRILDREFDNLGRLVEFLSLATLALSFDPQLTNEASVQTIHDWLSLIAQRWGLCV